MDLGRLFMTFYIHIIVGFNAQLCLDAPKDKTNEKVIRHQIISPF